MPNLPWISVDDFKHPSGWARLDTGQDRARAYCEMLERGEILFFSEPPFNFPAEDRVFCSLRSGPSSHAQKRILPARRRCPARYFPAAPPPSSGCRQFCATYSAGVIAFLEKFLAPYAGNWTVDFSSFRPFEEENRELHHFTSATTSFTRMLFQAGERAGGRILRVFTNSEPSEAAGLAHHRKI